MKKFFLCLFAVITFVPVFTYSASCLTPYVSPVKCWPMAFLALGFPYLASAMFLLVLIWFLINRKIGLILLLIFFAGFQNLFATFALNAFKKPVLTKQKGTLRILTWNVRGFDNPSIGPDSINSVRTQMFSYIKSINPDVLCLQEFVEHQTPGTYSNTATLVKLGYRYHYITNDVVRRYNTGITTTSSAIFSKTPITDSSKTLLGDPTYTEYLGSADIKFQDRTIRVFATHFKSINLFAAPAIDPNRVIFYGDSDFVYQKTQFEKLKAFGQAHSKEAPIAKQAISQSPFPVVIGIDMNSVPTSYPYHIMSSGLQDAFRLNGWGLGTTMTNLPKSLRIDFLLVDNKLQITGFQKDEVYLSDHFPQFIDVKWKE